MMTKVEASVDPDPMYRDGFILLGIDRPLSMPRYLLDLSHAPYSDSDRIFK